MSKSLSETTEIEKEVELCRCIPTNERRGVKKMGGPVCQGKSEGEKQGKPVMVCQVKSGGYALQASGAGVNYIWEETHAKSFRLQCYYWLRSLTTSVSMRSAVLCVNSTSGMSGLTSAFR